MTESDPRPTPRAAERILVRLLSPELARERPVLAGMSVGLALALAAARALGAFLFEVEPTDPIVYVAVAALLGAVAVVAGFLPARRASRSDPLAVLKSEP